MRTHKSILLTQAGAVLVTSFFLIPLCCREVRAQWDTIDTGTTRNIRDISFVDEFHGWAVGDSALVLSTNNGGNSWVQHNPPVPVSGGLTSLQLIDPRTLVISGWTEIGPHDNSSFLVSTDDGGTTWVVMNAVIDGIPINISGFHFQDGLTGWVAGMTEEGKGVIAYTADGGVNWTQQLLVSLDRSNYRLASIDFSDAMTGWAVGGIYYDGFSTTDVYRTINGGETWSKVSELNGPQQNVTAAGPNSLWVYWQSLYNTSDGGRTWISHSFGHIGSIRKVVAIDSVSAWTLHVGNICRFTADRGETFARELNIPSNAELFGMGVIRKANKNVVWVVGGEGLMLRNTDVTTSVTEDATASETILNSFSASPNPSNLSSTITYSLKNPSDVRLTVYSINGQKVATLVNGPMRAGAHSVTFNGAKLASGVYFYRFESAGLTKTGKMLLLK